MSDMCALCQAYYEKYPLVDGHHILDAYSSMGAIQCAFPDGVFSSKNWNCQTMITLRELSGEDHYIPGDKQDDYFHMWYRWDDNAGSIGVIAIPEQVAFASEDMQMGYLVMTWYKGRGQIGNAWVMCDEDEPQKLILKTAEAIIAHLQQKKIRNREVSAEQKPSGQALTLIEQYIKQYPT